MRRLETDVSLSLSSFTILYFVLIFAKNIEALRYMCVLAWVVGRLGWSKCYMKPCFPVGHRYPALFKENL